MKMKKTPNRTVLRSGLLCAFGLLALCVRGETVTSEPDAFLDYIEANGSQYVNTGVNAETGLKARIDLEIGTYSGPVDTGLPLYLFQINLDGTPRFPGKVRLYSLKLRVKQQDGTYAPARDLVPVEDPATGAPVLWDRVSETYFRNGGKYLLAGGGAERPLDGGVRIIVR